MAIPERSVTDELDLSMLLEIAGTIADERERGHLAILRSPTGWKAMLGIPDQNDIPLEPFPHGNIF